MPCAISPIRGAVLAAARVSYERIEFHDRLIECEQRRDSGRVVGDAIGMPSLELRQLVPQRIEMAAETCDRAGIRSQGSSQDHSPEGGEIEHEIVDIRDGGVGGQGRDRAIGGRERIGRMGCRQDHGSGEQRQQGPGSRYELHHRLGSRRRDRPTRDAGGPFEPSLTSNLS